MSQATKPHPGHDGRLELASANVESPYFRGEREAVVRNIRECPADQMFARHQIDEAQHRADARYRAIYESAQERRSFGVADPSREPVCVSMAFSAPLSDYRLDAIKHLAELRSVLGEQDDKIVRLISGQLMAPCDVAKIWARSENPSQRMREYIGMRYRDALKELAKTFGYAS
jgi:hypothetical protein